MTEDRYQQALDYIYSFVDYSVKRSYRYSAEVFDLVRVERLLEAHGNPHKSYPSVHIAGTKGKGSVSAMLASILQAAGYKVGLYTSPHLIEFSERIRVNGQVIPRAEVVRLVDLLKPTIESLSELTVFEIVTAMAFLYFEHEQVDYAIIEVGLGGRLDATNVVKPLVSVITSLSYDHMHLLGESLSDIAYEKAGIIKPCIPVVSAPQQYEAEHVIEKIAEQRKAPLVLVGRDWLYSPGGRDFDYQRLYVWSANEQHLMDAYVESAGDDEWIPHRYRLALLGHHQVINGAVAYAVVQVLKSQGVNIQDEAIQTGFHSVSWPGRFQILSREPLLVVDSAHNRDSALKLRIALDDYFPSQPVTLIFGASEDKDVSGMLIELLPRVSRLIVTKADHPRAADPEKVAQLARSHGLLVEVYLPIAKAVENAFINATPDQVILATGSIFIVGEVLTAWSILQEQLVKTIEEGVQ
jgi:dihydrofolate synthase/folylpolyglutamate synthase